MIFTRITFYVSILLWEDEDLDLSMNYKLSTALDGATEGE